MTKYIIFDLSEVIIRGLLGIESVLCRRLSIPEDTIISCFCRNSWWGELLVGNLPEDKYLDEIIRKEKWDIDAHELKTIIRDNFHTEIEGVIPIIRELSETYKLYLLSDHTKEWVDYIKTVHPFLNVFEKVFFSYELKMTKKNPAVFKELLSRLSLDPSECLFIDDHQSNVDNARLLGIDGICFTGAEELRRDLEKRNILT